MTARVCFIGGARYGRPLDATSEKKFRALRTLGNLHVVGFSSNLWPRRFKQHARFYLLPALPLPLLRYLEMAVLGPWVVCWLIFRHDVGVLVAQSPYEGVAAVWAKKLAGCFGRKVRLVVESHGDFEKGLFLQRRVPLPRLYRFLMQRAASFSLRHADALRAISDCTARQLERWLPEKPIMQFPTWTDIEVFLETESARSDKAIARSMASRDSADPPQHILYVGVLTPLKGVHFLLKAFASLAPAFPRARLVIIGHETNRPYALELREQAARLGLEGRVQFLQAMPQKELAQWMQGASVLVLPSTSEGLGRVLIESMATGTPVIGSNVGGIPEIVMDGENGFLVPPGDEALLAEKIRWILSHPGEARDMGRNGRAFAKRFFSTEAYVAGYRKVFEASPPLMLRENDLASTAL